MRLQFWKALWILAKTRNLFTVIIVLFLLYDYLLYKTYLQYVILSQESSKGLGNTEQKAKSISETTKALTVSLNLHRIKKFYVKKGHFFIPSSLKQIDWHNYTQIEYEKQRVGIGEQGKPSRLPTKTDDEEKLFAANGYNAALSEILPLNRSLPDVRHEGCKKRLYIESLPTVSVIAAFNIDHWTTILRTAYSVINRSPSHLLKEIFIVHDGNAKYKLNEKLHEYIDKNIPKVKLLRLPKRGGLVKARLAGAELATADVLIFMDSHMEVNVNWLPPLLEPIALDYQTVVLPLIDVISYDTHEYRVMDHGARGSFNWGFTYMRLPMLPKDVKNMPEPFETPVMAGGVFGISRRFFWELGGYDPGLQIWGGEQYEMSFKVWQCGGRMLEVPCSRVGHLFRAFNPPKFDSGYGDYIAKNFRRVAVVWMDEYANYLYARRKKDPTIDPGNITDRLAIRKRLKCKPFKWYMTQVAFDLTQQFPLIEPIPYAEGRIRPTLNQNLCVDGVNPQQGSVLVLNHCYDEEVRRCPESDHQSFQLTWYNDIKIMSSKLCWDVPNSKPGNHIKMHPCHQTGGNQEWRYFEKTKRFVFLEKFCLDFNLRNRDLFLNRCDNRSRTQMWTIDVVNQEQMAKWNASHTLRVTGPVEDWKD